MNSWTSKLLPVVILGIGIVVTYGVAVSKPKPAMQDMGDQSPPLIPVKVVEAQPQSVTLNVLAHGTTQPRREIDLVSQVAGIITSVEPIFVEGQFFDKDQILLQIDQRDYRVALLNAKARLADAERRLAEEEGMSRQAKREWRDLGNENANDLFIRKPQLAAAQAALKFAQADVEKAELDLQRTRITVPFAGRVKETQVDLGQYVSPGTRLARVYDTAIAEVRLPLTDEQAALLNLPLSPDGQHSAKAAAEIRARVAGVPHLWQAQVTRTDAFIDSNSRMLFAIAEVRDPFGVEKLNTGTAPLLPGLFVEAEISGKQLDDILVLPRDALYKSNELYVITGEHQVNLIPVEVLRKSKDTVWIRADIEAGTLILIEKQSLISTSSRVQPILETSDKPEQQS